MRRSAAAAAGVPRAGWPRSTETRSLRVDLEYRTGDGRADRPRARRRRRSRSRTAAPGYLFTFQDVTDIKRLERNARLQQRLAAVGEMAAGIAHEIRNPLASMSGSIQVLRQELPLSEEQAQLMDIVLRESERLNDTIRSFLAYARPQRFAVARLDVGKVVQDTALLLRNSADVRDAHVVDVDVPAEPVWYEADENQIRQIVWNLATNGLRAMAGGGRLLLSRAIGVGRAPDEVVLERAGRRAAAFPPTSSTASSSRSAARSRRAPGSAWPSCTASSPTTTARSRCRPPSARARPCGCACRCARVAMASPAAAGAAQARSRMSTPRRARAPTTRPPTRRRQAAHSRRRRRAVDARDAAHRAAPRRLRRACVAENGSAGDRASCSASRVDLLLSDIRMPDVSGVDVLRAAKELNRDIVAFMMTAFASTETAVEAMRLGAVDYFTKPFSMDELRLKVRQHLEAHRLKQENVLLKRALNTRHAFSNIIGRSERDAARCSR